MGKVYDTEIKFMPRDPFKLSPEEAFSGYGELGIAVPKVSQITNFIKNIPKVLSQFTKVSKRLSAIRLKIGKVKSAGARQRLSSKYSSVASKLNKVKSQISIIQKAKSSAQKVISLLRRKTGLKGLGVIPVILILPIIKAITILSVVLGTLYTINRYLDGLETEAQRQLDLERQAGEASYCEENPDDPACYGEEYPEEEEPEKEYYDEDELFGLSSSSDQNRLNRKKIALGKMCRSRLCIAMQEIGI